MIDSSPTYTSNDKTLAKIFFAGERADYCNSTNNAYEFAPIINGKQPKVLIEKIYSGETATEALNRISIKSFALSADLTPDQYFEEIQKPMRRFTVKTEDSQTRLSCGGAEHTVRIFTGNSLKNRLCRLFRIRISTVINDQNVTVSLKSVYKKMNITTKTDKQAIKDIFKTLNSREITAEVRSEQEVQLLDIFRKNVQ